MNCCGWPSSWWGCADENGTSGGRGGPAAAGLGPYHRQPVPGTRAPGAGRATGVDRRAAGRRGARPRGRPQLRRRRAERRRAGAGTRSPRPDRDWTRPARGCGSPARPPSPSCWSGSSRTACCCRSCRGPATSRSAGRSRPTCTARTSAATAAWSHWTGEHRTVCGDGELRTLTPTATPAAFRATVGGMGLTGVILAVTLRLLRIRSALPRVTPARAGPRRADGRAGVGASRYAVAWIDTTATGRSLGRGVVDPATTCRAGPGTARRRAWPTAPAARPPGARGRRSARSRRARRAASTAVVPPGPARAARLAGLADTSTGWTRCDGGTGDRARRYRPVSVRRPRGQREGRGQRSLRRAGSGRRPSWGR